MRCLPLLLPLILVLPLTGITRADTGYKCIDAQGRLAFQDSPCPHDQRESSFHYDPAATSPHEPPVRSPAPPPLATPIDSPAAADVQRTAIPALFACTRGDGGESYYSDSGATAPYTVPLGVLGYPTRTLGDVYGGRNGVGMSAPEFSRPLVLPPDATSAIAGVSVWVRDDCRALPASEACRVRAKQLDGVRSKLRRAFKDERARLEPRERELTHQLAGC